MQAIRVVLSALMVFIGVDDLTSNTEAALAFALATGFLFIAIYEAGEKW